MSRQSTSSGRPLADSAVILSPIFLERPSTPELGRPGQGFLDLGIAVLGSQHRADADEREAHVNAEVLQVGFAQIFGMRIVGLRVRVEEQLYLLVLIFFVNIASEPIITAGNQLRSRFDWMLAQLFLEQLAFDAAFPKLVCLGFVLRPG